MIPFELSIFVILGAIIIFAFHVGRNMRFLRLPSIIGYMILGVLLGPSILEILTEHLQTKLSFITEIALSFVAVSIGLELKISSLKKLGMGIIWIILMESFGAFIVVFGALYLFTGDLPLALIFGAIAPASAPAGTVAIIQEYKARGSLTKTLYAVVGFDDGLGIIIFGFAASFAEMILIKEGGGAEVGLLQLLMSPIIEISLSIAVGIASGWIFSLMSRRLNNASDVLMMLFGFVFLSSGLCDMLHLSIILTNMVFGMLVVNTQPHSLVQRIHDRLPFIMPLLFLLFFTLAGANLHLSNLPALGLLGVIYILSRTVGLMGGSVLGGYLGKVESKIRKYTGMGILSQAGVAIGLSLIVKHEFAGIGKTIQTAAGEMTRGEHIGAIVITTVTATCIFFEIVGPILTKIALTKAGEIDAHTQDDS